MPRKKLQPLPKEEFDALERKVNAKAAEYALRGPDIRLREEIWLSLWEMHPTLFSAERIRGFRYFSPSSLYETGTEFLTEVFLDAVPKILDSYAKEYDADASLPFMRFFNACFIRKVFDAYSDILDKTPHDAIVIREPAVQVYRQPREDAPIPDTFLKKGMERRVLGRESDGKQTWIKTKLKTHGQTVYVREKDVECQDKASIVDIDFITEQKALEEPDEPIMFSDTYDDYILSLLSLAEQLYSKTQIERGKGFNRQYGFQLLYTEKLLIHLKRIYEAFGEFLVRTPHEEEALFVAETDFLDYLLTDTCRTFSAIASTPLHAKRDFPYLDSDSEEEIEIFEKEDKGKKKAEKKIFEKEDKGEKKAEKNEKGIAAIIYVHFLTDIKGIQGKPGSLTAALSRHRTNFNKLYVQLCEPGVNRGGNDG